MRKIINRVFIWLGVRFLHFGTRDDTFEDVLIENDDLEEVPTFPQPEEGTNDFVEFEEPWNGLPTVCIDFDGVIHLYTSGWNGADQIDDGPTFRTLARSKITYTSIDWLTDLVNSDRINVAIFSTRNNQKNGIKAMKAFLLDNGMDDEVLSRIAFPEHKIPSHVLIDDRCMTFRGQFFSVDKILNFTPWKR